MKTEETPGKALKLTLKDLRRQALAATFFPPTTLARAVQQLGFVQADPIRSPARAQDLILRHRVKNYRAGDLEGQYPSLSIEEDFLYAYGFMPVSTWKLLHPRLPGGMNVSEERVLEIVTAHERIHPRELESYLGREREINAWGGYSKTTTRLLQALHYRGLLRVAGRESGVRLYAPTSEQHEPMDASSRLRHLVLLIASILAPISEGSLRATLRHLAYAAPALQGRKSAVSALLEAGDLGSGIVDEIRYVWPAGENVRREPERIVRFLAPFDPLVWDRRRFEHLWGWAYRFEAYTPQAKRKLGYYAMPLLWQDDVIGWVNISRSQGEVTVEPGYVRSKPVHSTYKQRFEEEVEGFKAFLKPRQSRKSEA